MKGKWCGKKDAETEKKTKGTLRQDIGQNEKRCFYCHPGKAKKTPHKIYQIVNARQYSFG